MANEDLTMDYIPPAEGPSYSDYWGGPAYGGHGDIVQNGRYIAGTNAAEEDVRRYRDLANRGWAPVALDRTQENEARALQLGSLANLGTAAGGKTTDALMLEQAAAGATPSRAEILGQTMSDRALRSQVSAAGNVRGGPGAQAAAYRYAAQNAAQNRAEMGRNIQAERAAEMATARGQYSQAMNAARNQYYAGATGFRAGDIDVAGRNAQLDLQERARQDQAQQFFERMGSDTRNANLQAQQNAYFGEKSADIANRAENRAEDQATWGRTKDIIGMGTGVVSGGASYAAGAAAASGSGSSGSSTGTGYYNGIYHDNPYRAKGGPVSGGRPYLVGEKGPELVIPKHDGVVIPAHKTAILMGSLGHPGGGYMLSDARAKDAAYAEGYQASQRKVADMQRYAFSEGARYAMNPKPHLLPSYAQKREAPEQAQASVPDEMADANRTMNGTPYAYKPGMGPLNQTPGEVNVGPMAQNLEQSPVAATAVKTDPQTGMKLIDKEKLLKINSAGIGSLQQQVDGLRTQLNRKDVRR